MVRILGTIDSSGFLLLDNYTIGKERESGITEIIITIDKNISKEFRSYYLEGVLPNGSTYTSEELIPNNDTIIYTVSDGLTKYEGIVKIRIVSYNDRATKWQSYTISTRVLKGNIGNIGNNSQFNGPNIITSFDNEAYVSCDLVYNKDGDKILYNDHIYIYGESAFSRISDAVKIPDKTVYIDSGVYDEIVNIRQDNIRLIGIGDVRILGSVIFMTANNSRISNITIDSIFDFHDYDGHDCCCLDSAIKVIGVRSKSFIIDNVTTIITGSGYGIDTSSCTIEDFVIRDSNICGGRYKKDNKYCASIKLSTNINTNIINNSISGKLSFNDLCTDLSVTDNRISTAGNYALRFSGSLVNNINVCNNTIYGSEIDNLIEYDSINSSSLGEFEFISNDVSYINSFVNVINTTEISPSKFIFSYNIIKRGPNSDYFTGDNVGLALGDSNIISGTSGIGRVEIAGVTLTNHGSDLVMSKDELVNALGLTELAFTNPEDVKVDIDLSTVAQLNENGKIKDENIPDDIATKQDIENAVAGSLNEEEVDGKINQLRNELLSKNYITESDVDRKLEVSIIPELTSIKNEIDNLKVQSGNSTGCISVMSYGALPNIGSSGIVYIVEDENASYRWDQDELKYYSIGRDYEEVQIIFGGNA